jgi:23S rRNA pseudouridine2605 synthase
VLTNDGAFAERIAHPRYEVPRVYHAKVRGVPDPETLARLRRGVPVDGERMSVDSARLLEGGNNAWVEVVLHEGRHHEVRRLLEAVGHPVSKLRRVALGPVTDRGLKPGEFRQLTPAEVRAFLEARPVGPRTRPAGPRRPGSSRRTPARDRAPAGRPHASTDHAPRGARPPSGRGRSSRPRAGRG